MKVCALSESFAGQTPQILSTNTHNLCSRKPVCVFWCACTFVYLYLPACMDAGRSVGMNPGSPQRYGGKHVGPSSRGQPMDPARQINPEDSSPHSVNSEAGAGVFPSLFLFSTSLAILQLGVFITNCKCVKSITNTLPTPHSWPAPEQRD